jgi:enoyl-CoA hydratase/carnithine racemase
MAEDVVLHEVRDDGVGILTLNRPDRLNAWTGELEERYFALLADFDRSDDVRSIVVTGAGRGFCPGADMDLLQGLGGGGGSLAAEERKPVTFPLSVRKPLIGAINGACAGVGFVQALMFDVRFAAAGAKFTFAFARRGLIAEYGSSWLLPRLVGMSRALDLMMSSRTFTAEEALDLGVVNYVVPRDEILDAAIAYAADLAQNCSPMSMAVMKQQLYGHALVDVGTALQESNKLMRESLGRADFKEGVASYVEKRPPSFDPLGS